MTHRLDLYDREALKRKKSLLARELSENIEPTARPRAFLLGGKSGAGKTRLHHVCSSILGGNAIIINGDEFRRLHPHFMEIQEQFGVDAPAHTAKWAGEMTEGLIDALSAQGYNLIIEGTLRTSDVPLRTARLLRERGYEVSLAIMAVKPEISLVSCQIRYELMRIAGTTPRATDPAHHDKIVRDIADNLSTLEDSGLFEQVLIYNRAGKMLYPEPEDTQSASDVLRESLFSPWSEEERQHYTHLNDKLRELRSRP